MNQEQMGKYKRLQQYLRDLDSVVIAFSGGVDSTFLAYVAHEVLGDRAVAFTVDSPTSAEGETEEAREFAEEIGITHHVVYIDELENSEFTANTKNRCYVCKKNRFASLAKWAKERGINWVLDGSNVDDTGDYRPGMRALQEIETIRSPLLETGFTKVDIRACARAKGLQVWNKPSSPCLATRVPYDTPVTAEALDMIKKGENYLRSFLDGGYRVRYHESMVRIEIEESQFMKFMNMEFRNDVRHYFESLGFLYVSLDLKPFVSGNLNRYITE